MKFPSEEIVNNIKRDYPKGTRVELVKMDDPFRFYLKPGCRGTVMSVDDIGTIHVSWDCGSSLGVAYGEDVCRKLNSVTTICYGERTVWDDRAEAIKYFYEAMLSTEGSERDRYTAIYFKLKEGLDECSDED